jgi:isopenicillin N synthase-like dioxygenase
MVVLLLQRRATLATGLTAARALFAQPEGQKRALASSATSSEGYSAAAGGVHECFEVKQRSPSTDTTAPPPPQMGLAPPELARDVARMYAALDGVARACLADVERGLRLPPDSSGVLSLLDDEPPQRQHPRNNTNNCGGGGNGSGGSGGGGGGGGGSGSGSSGGGGNHHGAGGSLTAMRLLHYHKVSTLPPRDAQATLGEHTDSSLLTVAPRSTARGLEVAAYKRGPRAGWLDVEAAMLPSVGLYKLRTNPADP